MRGYNHYGFTHNPLSYGKILYCGTETLRHRDAPCGSVLTALRLSRVFFRSGHLGYAAHVDHPDRPHPHLNGRRACVSVFHSSDVPLSDSGMAARHLPLNLRFVAARDGRHGRPRRGNRSLDRVLAYPCRWRVLRFRYRHGRVQVLRRRPGIAEVARSKKTPGSPGRFFIPLSLRRPEPPFHKVSSGQIRATERRAARSECDEGSVLGSGREHEPSENRGCCRQYADSERFLKIEALSFVASNGVGRKKKQHDLRREGDRCRTYERIVRNHERVSDEIENGDARIDLEQAFLLARRDEEVGEERREEVEEEDERDDPHGMRGVVTGWSGNQIVRVGDELDDRFSRYGEIQRRSGSEKEQ